MRHLVSLATPSIAICQANIPFHHYLHAMGDIDSVNSCSSSSQAKAVFLSPDERYAVWIVKKAERPELLERTSDYDSPIAICLTISQEEDKYIDTANQTEIEVNETIECKGDDDDDDDDDDSEQDNSLPLTDGCDLPHWRKHRFASLPEDSTICASLNIGYGCTLLRRERQFALPSFKTLYHWNQLCQQLLESPKRTAPVIQMDQGDQNTITSQDSSFWFEQDNVPVVIIGCTQDWPAMETCTLNSLVQTFGDLEWRFSDTHGETMTLNTYYKYIHLEGMMDDAPLAIYDSQLSDDERACLLDDYTVPNCFSADLFDLLPDDHRPPYRWILIGPARSGTGLHIDPAGTHAWVTLVEGCKRWVLFPYKTDPKSIYMQNPAIPSAIWFRDYYDKVMSEHLDAVEVLQRPGETVYVPAGWPHLVLNLETSVAITQNYASPEPSMERLWQALSDAEPEMAQVFYTRLEEHRPDLAEAINSTGTNSRAK
jgi:histone arginine demethylase JMJD6